ncbi:MAG: hypothetical protein QOD95_1963 [Gammaproteobacteria bacterium]|jgi:hypothetical protein|nr:hypothetical protein [Gammaproteobacteria bacterium]
MNKFMQLHANAPATLGAVVEAVTRLSTLGEAKILEIVTAGDIAKYFPYEPPADRPVPADTLSEEELVEASATPLKRQQRAALIQSSLPTAAPKKHRASSKR